MTYRANAYLKLGQNNNALDSVEKAIKVDPEDSYNLRVYAEVLIRFERYEEAEKCITKALNNDEMACNVLILQAIIDLFKDQTETAYKHIEQALNRNVKQISIKLFKDIAFDKIRNEEKFKDLFEKIKVDKSRKK